MRRRFVYVITMEQDQDGGKGHSDACSSRMVIAVIWSSRASAQRWPKVKVELRHQQTPDSLPTQITQTKEHFLGYPLHDREATIIHHFAFFKNPSSFRYPWVRAGLILTTPLVDHLLGLLARGPTIGTEFFIDVGHEFALLAWNRGSPSGSRTLTPVPYLCAHPGPGCAIAASPSEVPAVVTGPTRDHHLHPEPPVAAPSSVASTPAEILFAVKTCEKFHAERVPVLLNTWAKYVQHLRLYSDTGDASIPTIGTSIPNTSIGHCAKTLEILHLVREELRHNPGLTDVRWIMLVDDDTILR
ncbi:hypothetical protein pipiens_017306 [Culex pipiens pipiens]|uniref:Fringe-like glycosyltransferase domain-containing protein n=1 Tax=Culex pipiens pipiens TaxID=38569 RepID=A0ABD1CH77_CULPP